MGDDPHQTPPIRQAHERRVRLLQRILIQGAEAFVHEHSLYLYAADWTSSDNPSARDRDAIKDSPPDKVFTLRSVPL